MWLHISSLLLFGSAARHYTVLSSGSQEEEPRAITCENRKSTHQLNIARIYVPYMLLNRFAHAALCLLLFHFCVSLVFLTLFLHAYGCCPCSVLLMDEPTNHLDFESIEALSLAVASFGGAVIVISHNSAFLCTCCDELWSVTANGRVDVTKTSEVVTFEDAFTKYRGTVAANYTRIRLAKTAPVQAAVTTAAF